MHRNADGAGLIGDGAGDGLADPPRRIRRKLVTAAPLELVHGLHQADVALLNQVQELQSAIGIFLGDGNDEAEVGLDQLFFGLFGFGFSPKYHLEHALQVGEARFAGDFDFAEFRAARTQLLARLGGVVTFRGVSAALELARLALEGLQALDGAADLFDQTFLLKQVVLERARQLRHFNAQPRHMVFQADVGALLRFCHPLELRGFPQTFEVELRNLVENLKCFLGLVFDLLFGKFFVVELDDFLDRTCALAEVLADCQQFLEDDGGARDGLEHEHLAALDAFGDGDFALARQQRYRAHLAQVHANRVVRLFEHPRCKVEVALLGDGKFVFGFDFGGFRCRRIGGGAGRLRGGEVFVDIDTVALEGGEQVVNLLRRVDFSGQDVVYFVIEQVSALLAQGNELTYLVIFLFNSQRQEILPKSDASRYARGCAMQPHSPDHLPAESKDTKTQVSRFALKLRMNANR